MDESSISKDFLLSGETKTSARAAGLARLRAAGRAEGLSRSSIAEGETALAGAFALGDWIAAIRRAMDGA